MIKEMRKPLLLLQTQDLRVGQVNELQINLVLG